MLISIFSGAVAGLIHVLSGPDHLAAVAPLSLDQRGQGWRVGFRWGLGHASGVMAVGLLSLGLRGILPLNWLSSWAERLVGIVLIGIGIWGIRKAFSNRVHTHEHTHHGQTHVHIHVHSHKTAHSHAEPEVHTHTHAALAIGALHGVAGSSHFLGVLPALAFPSRVQAIGYLVAFGIGTVLAMASFSSLMRWLARGVSFRGASAYRLLTLSCSLAALVLGCFWFVKNY